MTPKVLSNITSLKERPNASQFIVAFIGYAGRTEEFVFISNTLSQCVAQCTALINYMFQCNAMHTVYIFPTESTTTYRNVYGRMDGLRGDYKMLQCKPDVPLTLEDIRSYYVGY